MEMLEVGVAVEKKVRRHHLPFFLFLFLFLFCSANMQCLTFLVFNEVFVVINLILFVYCF